MNMAYPVQIEIKVFWIIGFVLSSVALAFQIFIYIVMPCSRKLPLKLLTQMTVARLLNVTFEYVWTNVPLKSSALNDAVIALYIQTDAALICSMFFFTKNFYDDVIVVFSDKFNFTIVTIVIWLVTIPIGILCPLMLELDVRNTNIVEFSYFAIFYRTYSSVKFIILFINLIMFCLIFRVAFANGFILRTCLVAFGLVTISSVQVFLTDILTSVTDEIPMVSIVFGVINAFQILAITAIFVILVKNVSNESLTKKLTRTFVKETV